MSKRPAVTLVATVATVLGYLAARFAPIAGLDPNYEWLFVMAAAAFVGAILINEENDA